ncbi:MAG: heme ABC exporter ATP-binding protein CcmA [Hyphomonadaceae bacterium]
MIQALRLEVDDVAVARGGRRLFAHLSFRAGPDDYIEITGANGVGKSSLLRALAGLLNPESGRVAITSNLGPLNSEEMAAAVHLVGHKNGLKAPLPAGEHARYWRALFGGGDEDAALARLGLAGLSERPARALSAGQARRLALARLLIAPRPIWLLDEPAAGLDIAGRALLLGLVGDHLAAGGMVIAAVHEPIGARPALSISLDALRAEATPTP